MWAYPKGYHIFEGRNGKKILVLLLDSEDAVNRHQVLMKQHESTYDFPEYKPYITLSYDIEDFMRMKNKKSVLENIKDKYNTLIPKEFHLNAEYVEHLNPNWEK